MKNDAEHIAVHIEDLPCPILAVVGYEGLALFQPLGEGWPAFHRQAGSLSRGDIEQPHGARAVWWSRCTLCGLDDLLLLPAVASCYQQTPDEEANAGGHSY